MGRDRVEKAITQILDSISDGVFKEESPLPAEAELARFLDVSRTTMREAIRSLAVGGVLKVVHGTGTYVQPYRHHRRRWLKRWCSIFAGGWIRRSKR